MDYDTDTPTTVLRRNEILPVQVIIFITKLNRIPGIRTLEAREANFAAMEEVGKRAVKPFEYRINDDSRQIGMLLRTMSFVLLIEMQVCTRLFIVRNHLFQPLVVEFAGSNEDSHQSLLLPLV